MKYHDSMSVKDLQRVAENTVYWDAYWLTFRMDENPFDFFNLNISSRVKKLKEHQIKLRGCARFLAWDVGDKLLTDSQLERMLTDSQMWYAYVEKHSYFKPLSYSRNSIEERRALIINHQKTLKESAQQQGEEQVFKTNEDRTNSISITDQDCIAKGEFAMIYVHGGSVPSHIHLSEESVNQEAERLARDTKKKVFILRPAQLIEVELAPVKTTDLLTLKPYDVLAAPIAVDKAIASGEEIN